MPSRPQLRTPLEHLRWIVWAQRKAADEWVRERQLTPEQGFVLGFLGEHPGVIQRALATATRTSAASVSSLLQGLERRGLVERRSEPGDERSKRIFVTDAGAQLIDGFQEAMVAADNAILAPLKPHERDTLLELLATITTHLPEPGK